MQLYRFHGIIFMRNNDSMKMVEIVCGWVSEVRMKKRNGVAMIVVLVMVMVFSALILAVVMSATSAVRRANFLHDQVIAQCTADAGLQDCLYWMNYRGYELGWVYPCSEYDATETRWVSQPANRYFLGSDYLYGGNPWYPWTNVEPATYNPSQVAGSKCVLTFADSLNPDEDSITSTGYYHGRTATVTINIRGSNGLGNGDHNLNNRFLNDAYYAGTGSFQTGLATWGVPEAFNKHAIYALNLLPNPTTTTLKGNIVRTTIATLTSAGGVYTVTTVPPALFDIARPETDVFLFPPTPPSDTTNMDTYRNGRNMTTGSMVNPDTSDGVYYVASSQTYHFGTDVSSPFSSPNNYSPTQSTHPVFIDSGANVVFHNGVTIGNYFRCDGAVNIDSAVFGITGPAVIDISNGGTLSITGTVINGDIAIKGSPTLSGTWTLNGTLTVDRGCTISGTTTINAASSARKAALLVASSSGSTQLVINTTGGITVGTSQNAAVVYCATGSASADIQLGCDLTGLSANQAAMISYSSGSSANINLVGSPRYVNGLIFARGATSGTVNLSTGYCGITGAIVANGPVTLDSLDWVTYASNSFKTAVGADIYSGFKGGRRVYLPVPGSWRVR